jgi:uncharacterized protein YodC (DUF2158 family)
VKIGDIVVWRSGGPKMTVNKVFADAVECVWFNQYASGAWEGPYDRIFSTDALFVVEPSDP